MKYFTLELLDKSNSTIESEREIADKLWMENLEMYWNNFEKYEDRLPYRFVKEYSTHAFHDYNIESINFYKDEGKRKDTFNVELIIRYDDKRYLIKYINVTKYNIDLSIKNNIQTNVLLYSEIIPVDDATISHEILMSNRNSAYIEFKKIMFKKISSK
jgi:hypothetical protein